MRDSPLPSPLPVQGHPSTVRVEARHSDRHEACQVRWSHPGTRILRFIRFFEASHTRRICPPCTCVKGVQFGQKSQNPPLFAPNHQNGRAARLSRKGVTARACWNQASARIKHLSLGYSRDPRFRANEFTKKWASDKGLFASGSHGSRPALVGATVADSA
jgi:hypothetical protein